MDLFLSSSSGGGSPPSLLSLLAGSSSSGMASGWADRDSTVLSTTDIIAENRHLDKSRRDAFNKTGWKNARDEEGVVRKVYTTFRAGGVVRAGGHEAMKLFLGDTKSKGKAKEKENKNQGTLNEKEKVAAAPAAKVAALAAKVAPATGSKSGGIASFFATGTTATSSEKHEPSSKRVVVELLNSDSDEEGDTKRQKR